MISITLLLFVIAAVLVFTILNMFYDHINSKESIYTWLYKIGTPLAILALVLSTLYYYMIATVIIPL